MTHDLDPMQIETDKVYQEMGLTDSEYDKIKTLLGRRPNYTETGIFSVMWSEHCSYKTSKPLLRNFPTEAPQVLVGPGEGAGVVDIGDNQAVVFKMESHNSPSRINPFEGAATGVGGILRDVFSMGARPIAAMNSLRFGPLSNDRTKYLFEEVVKGIASYGNEVGVPTVGGEVKFDDCYADSPLVNAMVVGLVDHDKVQKGLAKGVGNTVIYAGGATGRDGIHGATHSSASEENEAASPAAGNPELEKRLIEACLEVVEVDGLIGMQDMGAAGLTSSGSEMAEKAGFGMVLNLDLVPQREEAMTAYEMMLSETQERMLLVVEKGKEQAFHDVFKKHGIDSCDVGEVLEEEVFRVEHQGKVWADIPTNTLDAPENKLPQSEAEYFKKFQARGQVSLSVDGKYVDTLKALLSEATIADKKFVYDQFDSEARGETLVGPGAGAGVVKIPGHDKAIAVSNDCNARYIYLDPHTGGQIAVAEAVRNITASGAKVLGITDGLNYGNPNRPEVFWQMDQSIQGISQACKVLDVPVISGNVSMHNESKGEPIFPTPIIGIVGLFEKLDHITPNSFQNAGDVIFEIGQAGLDFGGSELQKLLAGEFSGHAPKIDLELEANRNKALLEAIQKGLVVSAEDVSEGGAAVALAGKLMRPQASLGAEVTLSGDATAALFSETQARYIVSVKSENVSDFTAICQDAREIGVVTDTPQFLVHGEDGTTLIDEAVSTLSEIWHDSIEKQLKSNE